MVYESSRGTGSPTICGSAVFGDYAAMTTCPAGTVMISDSRAVSVLGQNATVANKTCARACSAAGECRETETDPALGGAATQYQCIDQGGVQFCFDPRDLSANYSVQAF